MDTLQVIDVLRETCIAAAVLVGPVLIAALIVGVLTSVLQSVTQVHDQTISFIPKLIVVGVVIVALMPWMTDYYVEFARDALVRIPTLVFGG